MHDLMSLLSADSGLKSEFTPILSEKRLENRLFSDSLIYISANTKFQPTILDSKIPDSFFFCGKFHGYQSFVKQCKQESEFDKKTFRICDESENVCS